MTNKKRFPFVPNGHNTFYFPHSWLMLHQYFCAEPGAHKETKTFLTSTSNVSVLIIIVIEWLFLWHTCLDLVQFYSAFCPLFFRSSCLLYHNNKVVTCKHNSLIITITSLIPEELHKNFPIKMVVSRQLLLLYYVRVYW